MATLNLAVSAYPSPSLPLNPSASKMMAPRTRLQRPPQEHPTLLKGSATRAWPMWWPGRLKSWLPTGLVPRNIGILKIDKTEGSDDDVMAGGEWAHCVPRSFVAEFWNREFVFNRGTTGSDVPDYVDIVRPLGYQWHIIFYREGDVPKPRVTWPGYEKRHQRLGETSFSSASKRVLRGNTSTARAAL